ncbi:MAG: ATP-dependent DNA helicase RecG [Spirochaetaceae bacterium]|nr:ATP-dependent DNA helicase RecG [Spirochaetaceae bacterium]
MLINELEQTLNSIKGLGPESAKAFANLGITTIGALLAHYPVRYEDRANFISFKEAAKLDGASVIATVTGSSFIGRGDKTTVKITLKDNFEGTAALLCFGRSFLADKLPAGKKIYLFGQFNLKYNEIQSSSFEFEDYSDNPVNFGKLLPIYGLSASLSQAKLRKFMAAAFELLPEKIDSLLPQQIITGQKFDKDKKSYLHGLHFPINRSEIDEATRFLIAEELFLFTLSLCRKKLLQQQTGRPARNLPLSLMQQGLARLPFSLTASQQAAIQQLLQAAQQGYVMRQLLQGDVGSGKTLVALLTACCYIQAGYQVALLAPTELLARQHAENADKLLRPLGIEVAFLSGNVRSAGRKQLIQQLNDGNIHLAVGTHVLFSNDITYKNLGFVIVDEQHRFGVMQRNRLLSKGADCDLLLMSATPIPRTLAMTMLGELDFASLTELPQGRLAIKTHLASSNNLTKVLNFVKNELNKGHQAYFVYPLIEQSEKDSTEKYDNSDLKIAEEALKELSGSELKDYRLALIHSKLDEEEKRQIMHNFSLGHIDVLLATSIVEVGIDVANATSIVIHNAERFGLAALHQLRGRVGRSNLQSYCFLVYHENLTDDGKERLKALYQNTDGFKIADIDLKLRGPGEFSGLKQAGSFSFKLANLEDEANKALYSTLKPLAEKLLTNPTPLLERYLEWLKQNMLY